MLQEADDLIFTDRETQLIIMNKEMIYGTFASSPAIRFGSDHWSMKQQRDFVHS